MVSVSTCMAVWPRAVTAAPSFTCAFVWPMNTAAPTAPAREAPPAEKLAAGSIIKISVSSPACSFTEPEVVISADAPISAFVVDLIKPKPTEPAPVIPPVEPAIPTTKEVRFCEVSAVISMLLSATTWLLIPAFTFFQNTLAPSATPTELLEEAASVPVKSVMVVLSCAVTLTDWLVALLAKLALSLISAPRLASA